MGSLTFVGQILNLEQNSTVEGTLMDCMTGNPVRQHWAMEEVKECTLLIRHLPEAIPHETLSRLLSNYGATSIRPCTTARYRSIP